MSRVTSEQIEAFRRDGAVYLPGFLAPELVERLAAGVERDLAEPGPLAITMEAAHRTFILDDHPAMFRKVFTLGQLAKAVEQAPGGLGREALLAHLGATRRHADPALDVPDPYRRGIEAASGCVASLRELLRAVLPALSS